MSRTRITPDEARRALYIDFEGRKDGPPVLLGCTTKSRVRSHLSVWQAVTEPRLTPLAVADGIESMALAEAVERILRRAERKDRLIVAWSERELDVVREYCPELLERFEARFRNARALAERWRNKCHDGRKPPSGALADYLWLTGYVVPERARPGRVGETIRLVRASLERRAASPTSPTTSSAAGTTCASTTATTAWACARSRSRPPRRSTRGTSGVDAPRCRP